MKIRLASDLHVDLNIEYFNVTEQEIIDKLNLDGMDMLILAGDTAEYPQNLHFCEKLMQLYPELKIIEIPGNHLYYSCERLWLTMDEIDDRCKDFARSHENYYFLNCNSVVINDIKFIGATMYTKLGERFEYIKHITNCMNDFKCILFSKNSYLKYNHVINIHKKHIKYIIQELNNSKEKCIVITHHAPFFEYMSDISHAFGINLNRTLCRLKYFPEYWVYAHTHVNKDKTLKYKNGEIKCICNQFGYKGESDYGSQFDAWKTFDSNKTIEV